MKYYSNIAKKCKIMLCVLFWRVALDFYQGWNCFLIFLLLQAAFCILIKYFYFWLWLYIICCCNKLLHLQFKLFCFFTFNGTVVSLLRVLGPNSQELSPKSVHTKNSIAEICLRCHPFVCTEVTCCFRWWRFWSDFEINESQMVQWVQIFSSSVSYSYRWGLTESHHFLPKLGKY